MTHPQRLAAARAVVDSAAAVRAVVVDFPVAAATVNKPARPMPGPELVGAARRVSADSSRWT
jgi:hypothetical protein